MVCETKHDCVLKIGVLVTDPKKEVQYQKDLENFKTTFDLIIEDDGSFGPIVEIISTVCGFQRTYATHNELQDTLE